MAIVNGVSTYRTPETSLEKSKRLQAEAMSVGDLPTKQADAQFIEKNTLGSIQLRTTTSQEEIDRQLAAARDAGGDRYSSIYEQGGNIIGVERGAGVDKLGAGRTMNLGSIQGTRAPMQTNVVGGANPINVASTGGQLQGSLTEQQTQQSRSDALSSLRTSYSDSQSRSLELARAQEAERQKYLTGTGTTTGVTPASYTPPRADTPQGAELEASKQYEASKISTGKMVESAENNALIEYARSMGIDFNDPFKGASVSRMGAYAGLSTDPAIANLQKGGFIPEGISNKSIEEIQNMLRERFASSEEGKAFEANRATLEAEQAAALANIDKQEKQRQADLTAAQAERQKLEGGEEGDKKVAGQDRGKPEEETGLPDGVAATPQQASQMKMQSSIETMQTSGTPKQVVTVSQMMSPAIDQYSRDKLIEQYAGQETKLQTQEYNRLEKERRNADELERLRTEQADARKLDIDIRRREEENRLTTQRTKRIEDAKEMLRADGRLTVDPATGNLDASAIALLDSITSKADADLTDAISASNKVFDAQTRQTDLDLTDELFNIRSTLYNEEDAVLEARQDRQEAFNNSVLQSDLNLRSAAGAAQIRAQETQMKSIQELAQKAALGGADAATVRQISQAGDMSSALALAAPFLSAEDGKKFQSVGTAKDGFYAFNPATGEYVASGVEPTADGAANFEERIKRFNDLPSSETQAVLRMLKKVFPGSISNDEREIMEAEYVKHKEEGGDLSSFRKMASGFDPVNVEHQALQRYVYFRNLGRVDPSDNQDINELIKAGEYGQALGLMETKLTETVEKDFNTDITLRTTESQVADLQKLVTAPGAADLLGKIEGTVEGFQLKTGTSFDAEERQQAQALASKMTTAVKKMRKEALGSAVTDSEEAFLLPIMPQLSDEPDQILIKSTTMLQELLDEHNAVRSIVRLPELSIDTIENDARVNMYMKLANKEEEDSIELQSTENYDRNTQCGAFVNDELGLAGDNMMGDTLESKMDSPNFIKGGSPIPGGYFVMDTKTKAGHVGIVNGYDDEYIYITDRNWNGTGEVRQGKIKIGSEDYKKITGFGS